METLDKLNIVIHSSLFPSSARPTAGLFVRERMFRLRDQANLTVISPVPWFPFQSLIRLFKPEYRPMPEKQEIQSGITVYFPRFFSVPFFFRQFDAYFMEKASKRKIKKLNTKKKVDLIDSHFTYPDGLVASNIASSLKIPSTITMRGTEIKHVQDKKLKPLLQKAWQQSSHIISVSQSLKDHASNNGISPKKITVIGNGVDTSKFVPLSKSQAKHQLGIDEDEKVLITVGGLVPRKGFHRVIEALPIILKDHPKLKYLIVGGASLEGNYEPELRAQAKKLNLEKHVIFCGTQAPHELHKYLSAADLFVLSTENEGWANVLLESISCHTPVVATDVGGNSEVISSTDLGYIVPFDDKHALIDKITVALKKDWDKTVLNQYAIDNQWDERVKRIMSLFKRLVDEK